MPARRRKRKLPDEDLLERLKLYEELLRSHGVDFDAYNGPENTGQPAADISFNQRGGKAKKEATPNFQMGKMILEHGESRYVDQ